MSYILGVDLSQYQGSVDFNQLKSAGYEFALSRMTYAYPGTGSRIDPTASTNYYGALAAGILSGGYHKVGWTDPIAEADFYVQAMSPLTEGDLLAYDIEPATDVAIPDNWSDWEQTFVQRIYDLTATWPLRYMNISMNNDMPAQGVVTNCASWVAAPSYGWNDTIPVNVPVTIQQGPAINLPGIPANVCDVDAFFGAGDTATLRSQLAKIGYHAPQVAPAPQPEVVVPTSPPVLPPPQPTTPPPAEPPELPWLENLPDILDDDPSKPVVVETPRKGLLYFLDHPAEYKKFWVALAGALVAGLSTQFTDATWVTSLAGLLTALGVLKADNIVED